MTHLYAITLKPLIDQVQDVIQIWYADDAAATSNIAALWRWWDELINIGPAYGYLVDAYKTHLIVKASHLSKAQTVLKDTQVNIILTGKPYLGAAL